MNLFQNSTAAALAQKASRLFRLGRELEAAGVESGRLLVEESEVKRQEAWRIERSTAPLRQRWHWWWQDHRGLGDSLGVAAFLVVVLGGLLLCGLAIGGWPLVIATVIKTVAAVTGLTLLSLFFWGVCRFTPFGALAAAAIAAAFAGLGQ